MRTVVEPSHQSDQSAAERAFQGWMARIDAPTAAMAVIPPAITPFVTSAPHEKCLSKMKADRANAPNIAAKERTRARTGSGRGGSGGPAEGEAEWEAAGFSAGGTG